MRNCINECKSGHLPDCQETETHRACAYAQATNGLLCERCYSQLRDALMESPDQVFYLRSLFGILRSRSADGSQKIKKEPPAPLNLSAYELSEDIFKLIVGYPVPVAMTASATAAKVHENVDRLLTNFHVITNRQDVKLLSKLIKLIRTAKKIYPTEDPIRTTAMPCPQCDLKTIYTPPQHLGDVIRVSCTACGFEVPPDKVAFYAHLAEKGKKNV